MHLVSDQTWPPLRDPVVRLVAQPFVNPQVLISGSGVDGETLQHAAAGGGGIAPLVLRPAVVDSLELKMSKVPPEFISEFLAYGKQQQLLHSPNHHLLLRGGTRQVKVTQEMVLLMDLYEWLAAVLTHNQKADVGALMRRVPSRGAVPARHEARNPAARAGGPLVKNPLLNIPIVRAIHKSNADFVTGSPVRPKRTAHRAVSSAGCRYPGDVDICWSALATVRLARGLACTSSTARRIGYFL